MRFPNLVILAAAAALVALSCAGEGAPGDEGAAGDESGDSKVAGETTGEAKTEPDPVEPQLDGSHAVFGLRVPRGMQPVTGPNRVYRFEGTLELKHVKRYVMRQVETGHLLEEPTGYLIRKARVVNPVGSSPGDLLLAVRIFRGRRGGASVDVWVEAESLAKLGQGQGAAPRYGRVGDESDAEEKPRARLNSTQAAKRAEQRKQAFEALEAASQGKPLPKDPDNPLNY